jgi:signal transduction histidine kinase
MKKNKNEQGLYLQAEDILESISDAFIALDKNWCFVYVNKKAAQLSNIERQKDEFIAIASHELKAPVTTIKAYGQYLQMVFKRKGDETAVEWLAKLDALVTKLNNLITNLLDVTILQGGQLRFLPEHFDLNELVNETVEDLQRTTQQHHIITELAPSSMVYADRFRIGQVVTNLLSNAIKYSPHAARILVKTETTPDAVTLCVQDFGVGIPKEKQHRLFERFYRVDDPTHAAAPGLGLGLYISAKIVKQQGGTIWVESETGKGSTFCFRLPLYPSSPIQDRVPKV